MFGYQPTHIFELQTSVHRPQNFMEILKCIPMKAKFLFHLNAYWFVHLKTCYIWMIWKRNQTRSTKCKQKILVLTIQTKHRYIHGWGFSSYTNIPKTKHICAVKWLTTKDSYRTGSSWLGHSESTLKPSPTFHLFIFPKVCFLSPSVFEWKSDFPQQKGGKLCMTCFSFLISLRLGHFIFSIQVSLKYHEFSHLDKKINLKTLLCGPFLWMG